MIPSEENGLGGEALGFPSAEDGLGGMSFFGNEDGEAAAGACTVGHTQSKFHSEVLGQGAEVVANSAVVEFRNRPGGEKSHAKLSAGDLFFERFDIGAHAEKMLGNGGDGAATVWTDQADGDKGATGHS
jgi:hypothetical protein